MANNTTNFTLRLRTQGLDEAQNQTRVIRENLEAAAAAAAQIGRPPGGAAPGTPTPGGSTGSRRVAASAAAQPTGAAGATAGVPPVGGGDVENYNRMRGAAGAAGGTARDFADQARGLGGLVRLYATVAANVFALTAAFNALSRAMDTSNMVKGLDQLGAASGVALGSLSKRLVIATDGAISLRDAMEATTKAVSSGMKSDDVLRLGNIAKQASQALGVNMTDAVSRLTRGITKLEPELLDELGIFTKLDPAVKEYAKSVNKSVSELTDFERRSAFANAVLAEGEQKFSSIKIDANPYTKLQAAIANTAQQILEFVNKIVAPVANFFSQSPTALITGITALAAVLLKQALPAIGQFRQGLEDAANRSQQLAQRKAQEAQQARQLINQRIVDEVEARADRELRAVENAEERITQLQQGNLNRRSAAYRLLSRDLQDIDERDLQRVTRAADAMERRGRTNEATAYREVVTAIRAQIRAEADLVDTRQRLTQQVERDAQSWGTYGLTVRAGQRAQEAATRSAIVSNAAYNGSLIGVLNTMRLLREEIARNNITGLSAAMLTARGAIAAVGGAISTAMNALNGFFMVIGLITAAISFIDGIFSKASKEIDAFGSSVDRTEGSTKNLTNTFDTIRQTNPFSVQSLEAQANAMLEFSSSMDELSKNAQKALRALQDSGWDKFKDNLKGIFGADIQSTFTETFSKSIVAGIEGIDNKRISDDLKQKLGGLLGVKDVTNIKEVEKALKGLSPTSGIIEEIKRALKGASNEAGIAASRAREFVSAFDASKEAFRQLSKQFEVTDSTVVWANTSIAALTALDKNLSGPITDSIGNLVKASEELDKSPIFGSSSLEVAKLNDQLREAQKLIVQNEQDAQNLERQLQDVQKAGLLKAAESISGRANLSPGESEKIVSEEVKRLRDEIDKARKARFAAEASAESAALKVKTAINTGLIESVNLVAAGIQSALAAGSTKILQSLYSRIDNIPELAGRQFDLKIKELDGQAKLIKSQQDLANKIVLLTAETAVSNALEANKRATEEAKSSGGSEKAAFAAARVTSTQKDLDKATEKLGLLRKAISDPEGALNDLNTSLGKGSENARSYAQEVVKTAQANAGFVKQLQDVKREQKLISILEKPLAEEAARSKQQKEGLDIRLKALNSTKTELQLQQSQLQQQSVINVELENQLVSKLRSNQLDQATLDLENKKLAAATEYNNRLIVARGLESEGDKQGAETVRRSALVAKFLQEEAAQREDGIARAQIEANTAKERLSIYDRQQAKLKEILDAELDFAEKQAKSSDELAKLGVDSAKQELDYLISNNNLSEKYAANRVAELARENQAIVYQGQLREANLQRDAAIRAALQKASREQVATGDPDAGMVVANQEIERANALFAARVEVLNRSNDSTTRLIALTQNQAIATAQQNEEIRKQNELLNEFSIVSDSLSSAFGKVGASVGAFVSSLGEAVKTQIEYNRERDKLIKIESDYQSKAMSGEEITSDDIEKRNKAESDLAKLNKKNAKDELANNAKLVSSAKNMFKEKTAAHKVLSAVEKGIHTYRMLMAAKEIAMDGIKTIQSLTNSATRSSGAIVEAGIDGTAVVINQGKGDPYTAFARMAAMAVAVGALLSSIGGKSPGPVAGSSSADRQEVQGTGMKWVDGKKVETGGGVFGDPEAKSESISKSIDRLRATSVEGLSYDSKMLKALEAIRDAIGGAAKGLYRIPGLRTGSAFGTVEGTSSGGGLFGTGLFSSKTSKNITDSGLLVKGTFAQLAGLVDGAIVQLYEDVTYTKKKWYGKTSSWTQRNVQDVPEALQYIEEVFTYGIDLFESIGEKVGMSADQIRTLLDSMGNIDFEASLRGLKGEDLQKELENLISSTLDTAASVIFASFTEFAEFGEGALETVLRVVDQLDKADLALKSIGKETISDSVASKLRGTLVQDTVTLYDPAKARETVRQELLSDREGRQYWGGFASAEAEVDAQLDQIDFGSAITQAVVRPITEAEIQLESIKIADELVKAAGGLEEFLEQTKSFRENFLSEREQMEDVAEAISPKIAELGVGAITTRDQFKQLVQGADLTTEAGRKLYSGLMEIADNFNALLEFEEKLAEAREDQKVKILRLIGDEASLAEARNLERSRQLSDLDESLRPGQEYIYALEDEADIRKKLSGLYEKQNQELTKTVDGIKNAIKSLSDYRSQLLGGNLTVLTPMQQYQQKQAEFMDVAARARTGDLEALAKLPQVSNTFLEASRTMFASGAPYGTDFSSVMSLLDELDVSLGTQLTDAEKQLEESKKANDLLFNIEANSQSTADQIATLTTQLSTAELNTATARQEWLDAIGRYDANLIALANSAPPTTAADNGDVTEAVDATTGAVNNLASQQATESAALLAAIELKFQNLIAAVNNLPAIEAPQNWTPVFESTGG